MSRDPGNGGQSAFSAARWHALTEQDILAGLESPDTGLDAREAARRLERYGPNALPEADPRGCPKYSRGSSRARSFTSSWPPAPSRQPSRNGSTRASSWPWSS
ncbi:MAG: cation-transporting P-type ATPase [Dehalococcoidia bacterium]|nr:cation-transporting P-type ATPase [Dehalococcoidia bacterium]